MVGIEFRVQSGDWEVLLCRIDAFSTAFPRCPEELASLRAGQFGELPSTPRQILIWRDDAFPKAFPVALKDLLRFGEGYFWNSRQTPSKF